VQPAVCEALVGYDVARIVRKGQTVIAIGTIGVGLTRNGAIPAITDVSTATAVGIILAGQAVIARRIITFARYATELAEATIFARRATGLGFAFARLGITDIPETTVSIGLTTR
jgi:hypothetical protein